MGRRGSLPAASNPGPSRVPAGPIAPPALLSRCEDADSGRRLCHARMSSRQGQANTGPKTDEPTRRPRRSSSDEALSAQRGRDVIVSVTYVAVIAGAVVAVGGAL